jgi:hypothetical protein
MSAVTATPRNRRGQMLAAASVDGHQDLPSDGHEVA